MAAIPGYFRIGGNLLANSGDQSPEPDSILGDPAKA
jgi:hypothetical protein